MIEARASAASSRDAGVVLARCIEMIGQVRDGSVTGIGVGVPGQVDASARKVLSGGYVDLSVFDFAGLVAEASGLPVVIENDATMAMLGEVARGAATGQAHVVMLTIGTGIGGAILEASRVLRGRGAAGQVGHLVVQANGRRCVCGRVGCVETVSSGTAFGVHLAEAGLPAATRVEDLLARDDEVARGVISAWAGPLRQAIDILISTCNPEIVVIGGGAGATAVAALARVPATKSWFNAPVVGAVLGDDSGVVGAAIAAVRRPVKRAVLVNGVPASGKSGVARAVADALGWPLLTLDTIKAPFLAELPPGDRLFNRTLGRASYAAMFDLMHDAPEGAGFVLDAWFGFQPKNMLVEGLARAGVTATELFCHAPPEEIGARYGARVTGRAPGHPGLDFVPELVELAGRAAPMEVGPELKVDTTGPLDLNLVMAWLADAGVRGTK